MSWILRAELIVLALVAIVVVIHAVNRRVLQLKYSLIWLLISLCLVAAALFPKIAFAVTALVGIETPSNLIFFLAIIALLGICFSLTVIVSRQEARIKRLIQILSIEHNELKGSEEEEDAATERDNNSNGISGSIRGIRFALRRGAGAL